MPIYGLNLRISIQIQKDLTEMNPLQASGFLNSAELAEWRENFYVEEERVPRLMERTEIWNQRGSSMPSAGAASKDSLCRQFDLSEWSLWQDEAHKRHLVTESSSSKILRTTLEGLRYRHRLFLSPNDSRHNSDEGVRQRGIE